MEKKNFKLFAFLKEKRPKKKIRGNNGAPIIAQDVLRIPHEDGERTFSILSFSIEKEISRHHEIIHHGMIMRAPVANTSIKLNLSLILNNEEDIRIFNNWSETFNKKNLYIEKNGLRPVNLYGVTIEEYSIETSDYGFDIIVNLSLQADHFEFDVVEQN